MLLRDVLPNSDEPSEGKGSDVSDGVDIVPQFVDIHKSVGVKATPRHYIAFLNAYRKTE